MRVRVSSIEPCAAVHVLRQMALLVVHFPLLILFCLHVHSQRELTGTSHYRSRLFSILIVANPPTGHLVPPSVLGEELRRRGHNVTLCTTPMTGSNLAQEMVENCGMAFLTAGEAYLSYGEYEAVYSATVLGNSTASDRWKVFNNHPDTSIRLGNFLDRDNLTDYDIIIATERLAAVTACLTNKWKIPGIILGTTLQNQAHLLPEWPFPAFYIKEEGRLKTSDDMTFSERMHAFLFNLYSALQAQFYRSRYEFICPDPTVDYAYMNSYVGTRAPHIIPTAIGFEYSRTISPLTHYVGPLLSKQTKALPSEIQEWLDSKADNNVIMISMGSLVPFTQEQGRIVITAIQSTNYSVVWSLRQRNRYILEGLELDKNHYFLSSWLPQVAVLNHSAIGMAILHGGINGVHEAISYGVPIIVIPSRSDQGDVAARLHNSGAGIQILKKHLSVDTLLAAIEDIQNGRLAVSLAKLKRIFWRAGGVDRAADLVEHYCEVGYTHLIPAYVKYNWSWIQYYNIDLKTVLLIVTALLVYVVCKFGKCI